MSKVTISDDAVEVEIDRAALARLVTNKVLPEGAEWESIHLRSAYNIKRSSRGVKIVSPPRGRSDKAGNEALLNALSQAHRWLNLLTSGKVTSFAQIARQEGTDIRHVSRTIKLAFLAPEIVKRALDPNDPFTLEVEKIRRGPDLPLAWAEQEKKLLR